MAEPWLYRYTDFGEGRGRSPQPVLRAVVEVSTLGAPATFQAVVDTGGPITVIASDLLDSGGDPVATHVDARRSSDGKDVDRAACVAALRRR